MTPAELVKAKIARALSAAPPDIAKDATVAEMNFLGKMTVLRPGTNEMCIRDRPSAMPVIAAETASAETASVIPITAIDVYKRQI